MAEQTNYNVDILVAEGLLVQVDAMKKPENVQAAALASIAQSLIAIAKIMKEKR